MTTTTYNYEIVDPHTWLTVYGLDHDHLDLLNTVETCRPINRSLVGRRGDAWVREYSRIVHQTSPRHAEDSLIFTTSHWDLCEHLNGLLGD